MGLPAPAGAEGAAALPARLGAQGYLLASWNAAAMASSQHWESGDIRGRPVSPRTKVSWPAARATVATRLQARIMSNCTVKPRGRRGRWSVQVGDTLGWGSPLLGLIPLSAWRTSLTLLPVPHNPVSCTLLPQPHQVQE